jgi:2-keto-4-pentenoate hydratase/2-oxohepta-3-ene-1,7-dioic acid hydratase in catechol pathway
LPAGRDQVDWECELSVVVGREADHVPVERARDYIAGFTLQNDVSDRAGRGDGRHGSDWFMGKSHPTFAPLGPYIVPKEFVADPQKLGIKFTLSGKVMQDSSTDRMTHTVYEMLSYVSHIMTLKPGDIVATGSPAGVGAARKIFMKPGDLSVCTIESIGTLTNPVVGPGQGTR